MDYSRVVACVSAERPALKPHAGMLSSQPPGINKTLMLSAKGCFHMSATMHEQKLCAASMRGGHIGV